MGHYQRRLVLEASGAGYPAELGGHALQALDGETLMPLLEGRAWSRRQPIFWEHEGNGAVRQGNFKLVRQFKGPWELYDMEADRSELNDLMGKNDPLTDRLTRDYEGWAEAVGVLDWELALPRLMAAWQMADIHG